MCLWMCFRQQRDLPSCLCHVRQKGLNNSQAKFNQALCVALKPLVYNHGYRCLGLIRSLTFVFILSYFKVHLSVKLLPSHLD